MEKSGFEASSEKKKMKDMKPQSSMASKHGKEGKKHRKKKKNQEMLRQGKASPMRTLKYVKKILDDACEAAFHQLKVSMQYGVCSRGILHVSKAIEDFPGSDILHKYNVSYYGSPIHEAEEFGRDMIITSSSNYNLGELLDEIGDNPPLFSAKKVCVPDDSMGTARREHGYLVAIVLPSRIAGIPLTREERVIEGIVIPSVVSYKYLSYHIILPANNMSETLIEFIYNGILLDETRSSRCKKVMSMVDAYGKYQFMEKVSSDLMNAMVVPLASMEKISCVAKHIYVHNEDNGGSLECLE